MGHAYSLRGQHTTQRLHYQVCKPCRAATTRTSYRATLADDLVGHHPQMAPEPQAVYFGVCCAAAGTVRLR